MLQECEQILSYDEENNSTIYIFQFAESYVLSELDRSTSKFHSPEKKPRHV